MNQRSRSLWLLIKIIVLLHSQVLAEVRLVRHVLDDLVVDGEVRALLDVVSFECLMDL